MKEEIIMQKKYYKSIVVGAVMLLILALSATGCGKNTGEQVKQLIGSEKTDTKETSESEIINGAATENPESASDPGAADEDENENEPIQTSGSDSPAAEKAIDNPVFVKGFIPDGKGTIIYDFYYLDLDTGEMNKFFTFESKDLDFHEDIKKLITNRSFMGDTRLYDPYIRSDLLFNEDMTAIAVQWRESDQSAHVGWCDSEGNVTDVTDKIYNTKSDFDLLPNNHYPLFGPDNSLWFYDFNLQTYRKYDIDTGRVEDPEEPLTVGMTDILYVIYGEDTIRGHNIGSGSLVFSGDSIQRYNYINEIISNTTNYINSCLNNDIEPCPSEIIENSLLESCRLDCTILSNLIEIYGFALNRMTYLIKVAKTDNNLNLSDEAYKLLKILELSKEELEAKYRKNSESYDITKIDLDTWLNDSVNKDISAVNYSEELFFGSNNVNVSDREKSLVKIKVNRKNNHKSN